VSQEPGIPCRPPEGPHSIRSQASAEARQDPKRFPPPPDPETLAPDPREPLQHPSSSKEPQAITSLQAVPSSPVPSQVVSAPVPLDTPTLAPTAPSPACAVTILNAVGQTAGYICADANGLYRTNAAGDIPAKRVQLREN